LAKIICFAFKISDIAQFCNFKQVLESPPEYKKTHSLNGGDKGGSSIVHPTDRDDRDEKSDCESAIMPRKLNLKIHTNIDDNFEIHSSDGSSIISNIHADPDQHFTERKSFQATGET
jgi:hypothetical protein